VFLFLLAVTTHDILEIDRPTVVVVANPALRIRHQHHAVMLGHRAAGVG
jgi:hypothetical protein